MLRRQPPLLSLIVAILLIAGVPGYVFAKEDAAAIMDKAVHMPDLEKKASEPGLPQLDPRHFPSQALWLVIAFSLTYVLMRYLALPRVESTLARRQAHIEKDLAQAKQFNEEVKRLSAELDLRMNDARTRAHERVNEAARENAEKLAAAFAEQQKKLDAQLKKAEGEFASQKQKVLASLDSEAAEMVEAVLKRLTGTSFPPDAARTAWQKAKVV